MLRQQGKLSEAEPLCRDVLRCRRKMLGDSHPDTLMSMNRLANVLSDQGRLTEAELLYRDALRCRRETLGETHPDTLISINNLARLLSQQKAASKRSLWCCWQVRD